MAFVQAAFTAAGGAGNDNVTLTGVVAGHAIIVFTMDGATCGDAGANGDYGAARKTITDGFGFAYRVFVKEASASGTLVITSTGAVAVAAFEDDNASGTYDTGSPGQVQSAPGTGANAVTSGSFTPAAQPGTLYAISIDSETLNNTPAVGNGTDRGAPWNFLGVALARLTSREISSTSSTAALFTVTNAGTGEASTLTGYIKAGGGGGGAMVGSAAASAVLAGTALGQTALGAGPTASASLTGTVVGGGALVASLAVGATCSGTMLATAVCGAALAASAALSGTIGRTEAAACTATATLSGALLGQTSLAASCTAGAILSGSLADASSQAASCAASATLAGTILANGYMEVEFVMSASIAGSLAGLAPVAAGLAASCSLAGTASPIGALACSLSAGATCSGTLSSSSQASASCGATLTGTLSSIVSLSANLSCGAEMAIRGDSVIGGGGNPYRGRLRRPSRR